MDKRTAPSRERNIPGFGIYEEMAEFPVTEIPSFLNEGIGAVCLSGSATIRVYDGRRRVVPGMVITLIPWLLVSVEDASDDFRLIFFRISQEIFTDTLSTLWRLTPEFFTYMHKNFVSEADESYIPRFRNYCDLMAWRAEHAPPNCRRESLMQLLRILFWDVYAVYVNDPHAGKSGKYSRKEELAFRFMRLIIEEHASHPDVAGYAERLGVSPKYLTNLIHSISGRSARDWIVYFRILEIKSLLRESTMDLKTIASRVNFPDQSSLCRFFRRYAEVSPSQYRKNIHF